MYKVGDKVKIKSLEKLQDEFLTDTYGNIETKCTFTNCMRRYCGKEATITHVTQAGNYWLDFGKGTTVWNFSEDTFEEKKPDKVDPVEYKVGDKVRVKKLDERPWYWDSHGQMDYLMGKVVTVIDLTYSGALIVDGGWVIKPEHIEPVKHVEPVENKFIFIYREGNEVIAFDNTNKKGIAKCHPDDEFNFKVGARIAFDRLIGNEPDQKEEHPKYYNGKIVITKCDTPTFPPFIVNPFTVGKIYEIKDGRFTTDDGGIFPVKLPITSIEDLRDYFNCDTKTRKREDGFTPYPIEFVEVVE